MFALTGGAACAQSKPITLTPAEQKQLTQLSPEEQKNIKQQPMEDQQRILSSMVNMTPEERKVQANFTGMEKCLGIKDPDERFTAISNFVKSHPSFMNEDNAAFNLAYSMRDYIKDNRNSPELLKAKLSSVDTAFSLSTDFGRSLYESEIARFLLADSTALDYAASQAQSSIRLLHESEYLASKKAEHAERENYEKRDKLYVPEEFSPVDAKADFDRELSARYATLGDIQKKLGKSDAALDSYKQSLKFHPDMKAYVGISELDEAKGDKADALENLYQACLTGHLNKTEIAHMKQMYAEVHPGSSEQSLESLLDEKYRSQFHNPVRFTPYTGSATSHRAVLAEVFTGAGCEPCMSPDLAFDADLHRYTRDEMVLLVYHDNAPDSDPLANNVTEERAKYYSTGDSTPHTFLDGQEIGLVQGPPTHAQDSFDAIAKSIDKLLDVPAGAEINVHAKRHGSKVTVTVKGSIAKPAADMVLHIDLLETEVSYSGENTLRFQPMIVRATAQQKTNGSGFDLSNRAKFEVKYTFDLQKITAANFAYYSQYDAGLKKRTHGMLDADYREYENTMNPDKLAVAAFVQKNASKDVVQAVYIPVAGSRAPAGNSEEQ
jgi:tetratricopeptide (TPR) repeat protein